jgi:hypothetical protein
MAEFCLGACVTDYSTYPNALRRDAMRQSDPQGPDRMIDASSSRDWAPTRWQAR